MITKTEVIEIMLRPYGLDEESKELLTKDYMLYHPHELTKVFKKTTHLLLMYDGQNHYSIKY